MKKISIKMAEPVTELFDIWWAYSSRRQNSINL